MLSFSKRQDAGMILCMLPDKGIDDSDDNNFARVVNKSGSPITINSAGKGWAAICKTMSGPMPAGSPGVIIIRGMV